MSKKPPKTPNDNDALAALFRGQGRGRHRKLTAKERDLWNQVTETVEPLGDRPKPQPLMPTTGTAPAPMAVPKRQPTARPLPQPVDPKTMTAHRPQNTELDHGKTPGIDKRTAGKFKKGRMNIEGRLDLHGHSQREGHVAVKRFIADAYAAEKRCVLIVTGKGRRTSFSESTIGVLRQSVPRWLNEPGLRAKILSFSYATPQDGGEGALYVLLKRRRGE